MVEVEKYSENTVFYMLKYIKPTDYFIYKIQLNTVNYIGSTNKYSRRIQEHKKALAENTHVNNALQAAYNLHPDLFYDTMLLHSQTCFRKKVLKVEQRYINKYSNSNEAVASKYSFYDLEEFLIDVYDFIWRVIWS